jgi:hypothetical protein
MHNEQFCLDPVFQVPNERIRSLAPPHVRRSVLAGRAFQTHIVGFSPHADCGSLLAKNLDFCLASKVQHVAKLASVDTVSA